MPLHLLLLRRGNASNRVGKHARQFAFEERGDAKLHSLSPQMHDARRPLAQLRRPPCSTPATATSSPLTPPWPPCRHGLRAAGDPPWPPRCHGFHDAGDPREGSEGEGRGSPAAGGGGRAELHRHPVVSVLPRRRLLQRPPLSASGGGSGDALPVCLLLLETPF
jgi:hypothetical protein